MHPSHLTRHAVRPARARRRDVARAAGLLVAVLACAGPEHAPLPDGPLLAGDAEVLRRVLERLEGFRGTPLARGAEEIRRQLAGCTEFVAWPEEGHAGAHAAPTLRCREEGALPEGIERLRGDAPLVFVAPLGPDLRAAGTARVEPDGSVELRARLHGHTKAAPARFLLPAGEPPGPAVLSTHDTLVHGRFRAAEALDIAALVPEESQGQQLFRLKSRLFTGAVLDDTWEIATYLPPRGQRMPLVALAVGFRVRRLAVEAMEEFLQHLTQTWPVHPIPFEAEGRPGACLPDLRIMPEFGPCYVSTDRALVVGWNPASVRHALQKGPDGLEGESNVLVVHLDRFDDADARLQETVAPETPPARLDYAWERLEMRGMRRKDAVYVHATLRGGGAS